MFVSDTGPDAESGATSDGPFASIELSRLKFKFKRAVGGFSRAETRAKKSKSILPGERVDPEDSRELFHTSVGDIAAKHATDSIG